jgi:hypothetical protein
VWRFSYVQPDILDIDRKNKIAPDISIDKKYFPVNSFLLSTLHAKYNAKSLFWKTLRNFREGRGVASEGQHHSKYIPLKGVVTAELGSEFGLIPLKPLPGHGRS